MVVEVQIMLLSWPQPEPRRQLALASATVHSRAATLAQKSLASAYVLDLWQEVAEPSGAKFLLAVHGHCSFRRGQPEILVSEQQRTSCCSE